MGLAGARIAHQDHRLPLVNVLTTQQLADQNAIERGLGLEQEILQGLGIGRPGGLQPPRGGMFLALDQFQFTEL